MSLGDQEKVCRRNWQAEVCGIAQKELNEPEDPEERRQFVEKIRNWIVSSDEFRGRTDEEFIVRFLRVCKYDLKKTEKRLKRYYRLRYKENKWFQRTDETEKMVTQILTMRIMYYMNYHAGCQENLFYIKFGAHDPKKINIEMLATCVAQFNDIILEDQRFQTHGCRIVACAKDVGFDIISQATPLFIWRYINCWQNAMPIRIKGIHLINASPITYEVVRCVKSLLSKKLKSRLHVHKIGTNTFTEMIQPKYLTDEIGGSGGSSEPFCDDLLETFINGQHLFKLYRQFSWIKGNLSEAE